MGAYGDHLEYLAIRDAFEAIRRIDIRTAKMEEAMATLNDALTGIAGALGGLEEDVNRLIAAVANENLSTEAQAAVDAIQARMAALNSLADTAVPPAPANPL